MNLGRLTSITLLLLLATKAPLADTFQVDVEDFKRLVGEVADLRDANTALQRRVTQLESRNESLQNALRESSDRSIEKFAAVASRDDLGKMADKLREIDQKREADRKLILEQFERLATALSAPTEPSAAKPAKKADGQKSGQLASSKPIEGRSLTYKVQPGDMLEKVLKSHNQDLEKDSRPHVSLEQVEAANPGLNPNNLIAGRTLELPVPDRK